MSSGGGVPERFFKISFIIFGCAGSALLCEGFLYLWRVGASLVGEHGLWGMGASVVAVWTQQLWCMGSALCDMGDLPGPGIELVSPASADGFFTTEPSGKQHPC